MRVKIFLGVLILFVLNTAALFAQGSGPGEPCEGNDPDSQCPLDNWVIILALVAVVFATWHLYRKRKTQKTNLSR